MHRAGAGGFFKKFLRGGQGARRKGPRIFSLHARADTVFLKIFYRSSLSQKLHIEKTTVKKNATLGNKF
jgi:hypothetical protein